MARRYFGWKIFLGHRPYKAALEWQKRMVRYRANGTVRDTLFFFEHPDVITLGRDCPDDKEPKLKDVELFRIARGGGYTYHGPGQLVVYPIFDLGRRGKDLRKFILDIEEGIIRTFGQFGLACRRHPDHTGVWVGNRKIASIGVAVKQWISFHGAAINLTTDLQKFKMIRPCGLEPKTMTNLKKETGIGIESAEFADKLVKAYTDIFDTEFHDVTMDELIEEIFLEESSQSL